MNSLLLYSLLLKITIIFLIGTPKLGLKSGWKNYCNMMKTMCGEKLEIIT